jgi:DNA-binding PadR family transcriptional regulator
MLEEFGRRGYQISAGTLYPILYGLQKKGCLRSSEEPNGKSLRKLYRATPLGRKAPEDSKGRIRELFHEVMGEVE